MSPPPPVLVILNGVVVGDAEIDDRDFAQAVVTRAATWEGAPVRVVRWGVFPVTFLAFETIPSPPDAGAR